jgi:hypothetical protein
MPVRRKSKSQAVFHHVRLTSPRSIRVLKLLPSTEFDSLLEANLAETSLDDPLNSGSNTSYEALSYVWGSRVGTEPFVCDGKVLLVTPNCQSALRHLRQKSGSRILWVDAICIDQESGEASVRERNAQVSLMGEIYAKAIRTLCWLGQGTDFTQEAMLHLQRIGECPSKRGLNRLLQFEGTRESLQVLRELTNYYRKASRERTIGSRVLGSEPHNLPFVAFSDLDGPRSGILPRLPSHVR